MVNPPQAKMGTVEALWRYPVKSMMGEELPLAQVNEHGILGDRSYAILDLSDGNVATAKNPKKWPTLFHCKATVREAMDRHEQLSPAYITLPDGTNVISEQADLDQVLSKALKRPVMLVATEHGIV